MQPTGDEPLLAGRYRLMSLLGRGGMAEVYDAFDERLDRPVAIKLLRHDLLEDAGREARFAQEARSAARLSHPGVVAVYDSGTDQGRAFLVMERLPGDTLSDRMRAGPVDPRWLATRADEVLGALGAAHRLGMVHRDIKPANILLAEDGTAKLGDFGIAKTFGDDTGGDPSGDLTATGIILGTVAYLSPEQIHGDAASPRSDIYALGVVLYEALAGEKPYRGADPIAQAHAAMSGDARDLLAVRPDLDPGLAAVVKKAMAKDPDDRFASAAAMRAALEATGLVGAQSAGSQPAGSQPAGSPPAGEAPTALMPLLSSEGPALYDPTGRMAVGASSGSGGPSGPSEAGVSGDEPNGRDGRRVVGIVAVALVLLAAIGVVTFIVYNHEQSGSNPPAPVVTTTTKPASTTTSTTKPTSTSEPAPATTAGPSTTSPAPTTTAAPATSATTAPVTTATTTPTTPAPTTTSVSTTSPATTAGN